jgi:hypothetical protein
MAKLLSHERYLMFLDRLVAVSQVTDKRLITRVHKHLMQWKQCPTCVQEAKHSWLPVAERQLLDLHKSSPCLRSESDRDDRYAFELLHRPSLLAILALIVQKGRFKVKFKRDEEERAASAERTWDLMVNHPDEFWMQPVNPIPTISMPNDALNAVMNK